MKLIAKCFGKLLAFQFIDSNKTKNKYSNEWMNECFGLAWYIFHIFIHPFVYYAYRCTKHFVSHRHLWRFDDQTAHPNDVVVCIVIAHEQHTTTPAVRKKMNTRLQNKPKLYLFIKCTNIRLFIYIIIITVCCYHCHCRCCYCYTSDEFYYCSIVFLHCRFINHLNHIPLIHISSFSRSPVLYLFSLRTSNFRLFSIYPNVMCVY